MFSRFNSTAKKSNIALLDGVRAIACLMVVAFHINLKTMTWGVWQPSALGPLTDAFALTGYVGVTLFFVLSGILLFMPYANALLFEKPWPSPWKFYLRRILRIWPGYYVALLLLILLVNHEYLQYARLSDLALFMTFLMDSSSTTYQQINGPFWTLAVEWQFYMLLPLLALVFLGLIRLIGGDSLLRRWWTLIGCLVALVAWGVFMRYMGFYLKDDPNQTFLFPRSVVDCANFFLFGRNGKYLEDFALGMLVSSFYILGQQVPAEHTLGRLCAGIRRFSWRIWSAGIIVLVVMTLWDGNQWFRHSIPLFDALYGSYAWLSEVGFSLGFGLCVLSLLFGSASLKRPFEWAPLRKIGMISYSMYIWHLPLLLLLMQYLHPFLPLWDHTLIYILFYIYVVFIIIPFSYVFFKLIEQPWIHLGSRWSLLNRVAVTKEDEKPSE